MGYLIKDRRPPTSKLSPRDVIDIKIENERTVKLLADKYGVTRTTIRNIFINKTWRHVRIRILK